jgi:hypothetical protein
MSMKSTQFLAHVSLITLCATGQLYSWYFHYQTHASVTNNQNSGTTRAPLVTILLAPAGDVHNQGRSLEHQFEHSITMTCAQSLKNTIETLYPDVRVLISHRMGESYHTFQVATMGNTMDIDLVISLHCYHEEGAKPIISLYHYSNGNDFVNKMSRAAWHTPDTAYLWSKDTTCSWIKILTRELKSPAYATLFNVTGPYKLPFKPLSGIKVPAIGIEMSLKQDDDWSTYIDPLAHAHKSIFDLLIHTKTQADSL